MSLCVSGVEEQSFHLFLTNVFISGLFNVFQAKDHWAEREIRDKNLKLIEMHAEMGDPAS